MDGICHENGGCLMVGMIPLICSHDFECLMFGRVPLISFT